jgi:hypothetical protein
MSQKDPATGSNNSMVELEQTVDASASELAKYDSALKSMGSRQSDPTVYNEYSTLVQKPLSAALGSAPPPIAPVDTQASVTTPTADALQNYGAFKNTKPNAQTPPVSSAQDTSTEASEEDSSKRMGM